MNLKNFLIGFSFFIIGQLIGWVQAFGPLIWPKLKNNLWFSLIILSPIIGIFYIYGTKYMYEAFNHLAWPSRFLSFVAGVLVFSIATNIFFKEGLNLKTVVSLLLCFIILAIQVLWKTK